MTWLNPHWTTPRQPIWFSIRPAVIIPSFHVVAPPNIPLRIRFGRFQRSPNQLQYKCHRVMSERANANASAWRPNTLQYKWSSRPPARVKSRILEISPGFRGDSVSWFFFAQAETDHAPLCEDRSIPSARLASLTGRGSKDNSDLLYEAVTRSISQICFHLNSEPEQKFPFCLRIFRLISDSV